MDFLDQRLLWSFPQCACSAFHCSGFPTVPSIEMGCALPSRRPFRLQTKYGRCHMCMCPMRPTLVWRGPSEGLVMMPCKTSKQKIHQSYPVWVPLLLRCFVSKGQGFGKGGDNKVGLSLHGRTVNRCPILCASMCCPKHVDSPTLRGSTSNERNDFTKPYTSSEVYK